MTEIKQKLKEPENESSHKLHNKYIKLIIKISCRSTSISSLLEDFYT